MILKALLWKGLITKGNSVGKWEIHPRVFDMEPGEVEGICEDYLQFKDN